MKKYTRCFLCKLEHGLDTYEFNEHELFWHMERYHLKKTKSVSICWCGMSIRDNLMHHFDCFHPNDGPTSNRLEEVYHAAMLGVTP